MVETRVIVVGGEALDKVTVTGCAMVGMLAVTIPPTPAWFGGLLKVAVL